MKETFDVFTLGFSTRSFAETVTILRAFAIQRLIDIRKLPGSKRTPQFNQEHLRGALPAVGIEYVHMKTLGGFRKAKANSSTNAAWHNDSFRAYADYMQTSEFSAAIQQLIQYLQSAPTVYVCTEAVFWRCHRQLVSDALSVRGFRIGHIFNSTKVEAHKLTGFARVNGLEVTYPSPIAL